MNPLLKNKLKATAHHLSPVIIVGAQGISNALIEETNHALEAHELIKVKINAENKLHRQNMADMLCQALRAHFIQLIGHIAVIYRKKRKKKH